MSVSEYILIACCMSSVDAPDPEQRALFIATVRNMDWPANSSDSSEFQQEQMIEYLDLMVNMSMNAMMFHVRDKESIV